MMKLTLFALVSALCFSSAAGALYSVSGDTDGTISAVSQGSNLPAVFAASFSDIAGGTLNSQSQLYYRKTSSTYVKFYVKCVGMTSIGGNTATYTLSYQLDGAAAKTVGTAFTVTSNPYILIENLAPGNHKLITSCTENAGSISTGVPATPTVETDPLIFNWKVDTAGAQTVSFTATPPTYDNAPQSTFTFTSSRAQDNYGTLTWTCHIAAAGASWFACGTAGATTTSYTVDDSILADGAHTFQAKATLTATATGFYQSDLGTLTGSASHTWTRDTTLPALAITSTPSAKSQFYTGKTAKFEFACKAGEVSCTYMCSFDGKDSATTSTTSSPGFFSCTSPLTLAVSKSTTHSFKAYAVDAAGNKSPESPIHMFYADGDMPEVMFDYVDTLQETTTQQSTGTYYATSPTLTTLGAALTTTTVVNTVVQYVDSVTKVACTSAADCAVGSATNSSAYHTVFQVPFAPATPVYQLASTNGVILANKKVNGKYYFNVLDSTNANAGRLSYHCVHPEMV